MTNQKEELAQESPVVSLENLFSPQLAKALRTVTQYLPIDDQLVASAYLAGVSGVLRLGTFVCGNAATKYSVPANLYMAIVGDSGRKKSPIQTLLVEKPAADVAQMIKDENDRLQEKWKMDNMWRKKSDRELEPIHISAHAQTFTAAALAQHLQAHEKRGLAKMIVKDEVSFLFGKIKAANDERRQQVLECFDGKGSRSDRATGPDKSYGSCHFSVYGAVQPSILKSFLKAGDPAGIWARFLFCRMPEGVKALPWDTTTEELEEINEAHRLLKAYVTAAHKVEPRTYTFCKTGLKLFSDYEHAQQVVAQQNHLNSQRALAGKKAGKVLRIAGLLHLLRYVGPGPMPDTIDPGTLKNAIDFVEELDSWVHGFHTIIDEEKKGGVTALMRKIQDIATRLGQPVSYGMVQQRMSKSDREGVTSDSARKAMESLVALGMGSFVPGKRRGCELYLPKGVAHTFTRF